MVNCTSIRTSRFHVICVQSIFTICPAAITLSLASSTGVVAPIARVPLGRAGDYTVLSDVLILLASEASSYVTTSVLVVADGYSENGIA